MILELLDNRKVLARVEQRYAKICETRPPFVSPVSRQVQALIEVLVDEINPRLSAAALGHSYNPSGNAAFDETDDASEQE